MAEERLAGGNVGGAVRGGDTVRRAAGPWTPAVHALLGHLADKGFTGASRPLGFDERGREVLAFLEGETTGGRRPRPAWVHAEDTLDQVARWMRAYHRAVADFVTPAGTWSRGLIIAHNDAASYNAAWHRGKLTGFFDWDFAGPATPEWDLTLAAFSWVPLHTRHWVAAEGFIDLPQPPVSVRGGLSVQTRVICCWGVRPSQGRTRSCRPRSPWGRNLHDSLGRRDRPVRPMKCVLRSCRRGRDTKC